ncbi:MAG: type II toxin-antitoxin system HicA family toxin [Pseudohongiellaceae bacterium]
MSPPQYPPLTYREVAGALAALGFEQTEKKSTGHEQWKKTVDGKRLRVTVSAHLSPFSIKLIKFMASQADMGLSDFHACCCDHKMCKKRREKELLDLTDAKLAE